MELKTTIKTGISWVLSTLNKGDFYTAETQNIETTETSETEKVAPIAEQLQELEKPHGIDNFKYRFARVKEQSTRQLEAIENYKKQIAEFQAQVSKAKTLEYKVEAMRSGNVTLRISGIYRIA